MTIEHVGFSVSNPRKMAKWYEKNLGCRIQYVGGSEDNGMVFISDDEGDTFLELIKAPDVAPTKDVLQSPTQLHFAFKSDDPEEDKKKLVSDGGKFLGENPVKTGGDVLLMVEDPWGNVIQLVKRGKDKKFDK